MSSDSQNDRCMLQLNKHEEEKSVSSVIDDNKASLGIWTTLLTIDWAAASLRSTPCLSSIRLLAVLTPINIILTVTAEYCPRWLETPSAAGRCQALDLESELATTVAAKALEACQTQAKAGLQAGEPDAESMAKPSDTPIASDLDSTAEDGESLEAWSMVDHEEILEIQDEDVAKPEQPEEPQGSAQPVAASAATVRVPCQSPLQWLAGHIFLLLHGLLNNGTNQSTNKPTERPASEAKFASDASAKTQNPLRRAVRMHQDNSKEEGLKLVHADPLGYLWLLLIAIGYTCYGFTLSNVYSVCPLEAIVIALQLCYNWVAGTSGIGWFAPLYPSPIGRCCAMMALWVHAVDCGLLPQSPRRSVRGPAATVQRPSEISAAQPLKQQSSNAVAQADAEATPQSVAEATPQTLAKTNPELLARATPQSAAEATPQSGLEATITSSKGRSDDLKSAVAPALDIAAIISDVLKSELEGSTKQDLTPPAGWDKITKEVKVGATEVSLEKWYGVEHVEVFFTTHAHSAEVCDKDAGKNKGEKPLPEKTCVKFDVWCDKGNDDDTLLFELETDGNIIKILSVSPEHLKEDEDGELECKWSPVFSELDPKMQEALRDYLGKQGVQGCFVMSFSARKEQSRLPRKEYIDWLQGMKHYLEQ